MKTIRFGSWIAVILGTLLPAANEAHASGEWPTFRNGSSNSGQSAAAVRGLNSLEAPSALELGGLIWATPVIDERGRIYVGSSNKHFYSFDVSGARRWNASLFDRPDSLIDSAAALASDNQVVVPGGDGDLHSYDRDTGEARWNFHAYGVSDSSHQSGEEVNSFEGNVQVGPNGWIYAGSDNGTMYCLDAHGQEQWHFKTGMMIWSSPAFARSGQWLAFGSLDGYVYLLDPLKGTLLDRLKIGSDVKATLATDGIDRLFFGASDGKFRAVRVTRASGQFKMRVEWTFKTDREVYSSAALDDQTVYFGSINGHVYALGLDGTLKWTYATYSPVAASPLLTSDHVILTGAANGKLYAIDAEQGTRLWSFQTSPSTSRKANLDSSPALDSRGGIWVGSYQGVLHQLKAGYCPAHPTDSRCEFGGRADTPTFGMTEPPTDGAYLRLEDMLGRYSAANSGRVGRAQPIHLRLAAYHGGTFLPEAAISISGLHVRVERDGTALDRGALVWSVSSDGKYLNLQPSGFLAGGSHYVVRVSGKYFFQSDWLKDRLQWFTQHKFEGQVEFDTEEAKPLPPSASIASGWKIQSLYLTQPKALDTYIPAGLDGQAFVIKPLALEGSPSSHFLLAVLPVLPGENGFTLLPEPARATVLEGEMDGDSMRAHGSFRMAAMGAIIPFDSMELLAGVDPQGNLRGGELRAVASCLKVKGNGDSYHFPWSIVDQVCDPFLRMIGYVVFSAERLEDHANAIIRSTVQKQGADLLLTVSGSGALPPGDHLLTVVMYDGASKQLLAKHLEVVTIVPGRTEVNQMLTGFSNVVRPGQLAKFEVLLGDRATAPMIVP